MIEGADIGPYQIVRRIALRERSEVLLARVDGPHGFQRTVVLKRLVGPHAHDPLWLRRLAAEAIAYARLSHSSIVRLYDFVQLAHAPTLVLEYVPGTSLEALLHAKRDRHERLGDAEAFYIGSRIFAALTAAHGARHPETGEFSPVIHRDVSPGNVLVSRHGEVKLGDFGVARVSGVTEATPSGTLLGTYGYMAPEQIVGDAVTVRADVYGAALLLWELLAGRHAFDRDSLPELEILQAMAAPRIPPIERIRPDLPPAVCEALGRALRAEPDDRIGARDMLDVLRTYVGGGDARASLADEVNRSRKPPVDVVQSEGAGSSTWPDLADPVDPDATTDHGISSVTASEPPMTPRAPHPLTLKPESGRLSVNTPTAIVIPQLPSLPPATLSAPVQRPRNRPILGYLAVVTVGLAPVLAGIGPVQQALRPTTVETAARPARMAIAVPLADRTPSEERSELTVTAAATTPAVSPISAPASSPDAVPSTGLLETPTGMANHRVFVDGLARGSGGDQVRVGCGRHAVRLGSTGRLQWIDVPCGGAVRVER